MYECMQFDTVFPARYFVIICYEIWAILNLCNIVFYLSLKIHITRVTQWCNFLWYYFQYTSGLIVLIEKLCIIKCWISLCSESIISINLSLFTCDLLHCSKSVCMYFFNFSNFVAVTKTFPYLSDNVFTSSQM
jgi:hypothetical protein